MRTQLRAMAPTLCVCNMRVRAYVSSSVFDTLTIWGHKRSLVASAAAAAVGR